MTEVMNPSDLGTNPNHPAVEGEVVPSKTPETPQAPNEQEIRELAGTYDFETLSSDEAADMYERYTENVDLMTNTVADMLQYDPAQKAHQRELFQRDMVKGFLDKEFERDGHNKLSDDEKADLAHSREIAGKFLALPEEGFAKVQAAREAYEPLKTSDQVATVYGEAQAMNRQYDKEATQEARFKRRVRKAVLTDPRFQAAQTAMWTAATAEAEDRGDLNALAATRDQTMKELENEYAAKLDGLSLVEKTQETFKKGRSLFEKARDSFRSLRERFISGENAKENRSELRTKAMGAIGLIASDQETSLEQAASSARGLAEQLRQESNDTAFMHQDDFGPDQAERSKDLAAEARAAELEATQLEKEHQEVYRKRLIGRRALMVSGIVGGVVAVAGAAGAIYTAYHLKDPSMLPGFDTITQHTDLIHAKVQAAAAHLNQHGAEAAHVTVPLIDGNGHEAIGGGNASSSILEGLKGHTIKANESVWGLAKSYLTSHNMPHSNADIADAVNKVLPKLQAQGVASANGFLHRGATI